MTEPLDSQYLGTYHDRIILASSLKESVMRPLAAIGFMLLTVSVLTGCATPAAIPTPTGGAPAVALPTAAPPTGAPTPADRAPLRPFPQHTTYAAGTIKPQHSQADLDTAVLASYRAWKKAYLKRGCGEGRFYVDPGQDTAGSGSKRSISISEGHGYGMVITAFLAGADPDAHQIFDGLYAFFRDHPSASGPNLMAWKQVEGCANIGGRNTGSATDGDMDIAYALLLADRQWGSAGAINYKQAALEVIAALKSRALNPNTHTIMLGDWVSPNDAKYGRSTRSSDFMPEHLRAYAAASGDAEWTRVADTTYTIIQNVQRDASPATGLLPDFIEDVDTKPRPVNPGFLESDADGRYGYNACRTPWRIATDYLLAGDARAQAAVRPINQWLRTATGGDPHNVMGGYRLDGTAAVSYYEPAFAAPFSVGAMAGAENQDWLNAAWDRLTDGSSDGYYSDTLSMQALIVMSGNWWSPQS
jgi:endo-1,4-beta-D-glucanase Y